MSVADFTYVATWTGWSYVAFVLDAHSRVIVGGTASSSKATALVSKALNIVLSRRDHYGHPVEPGLIHHSDAGSQYTSVKFTESPARQGLSASIGSVGGAYDNAVAESTIGLFKTEVIGRHGPFKTVAEVEFADYAPQPTTPTGAGLKPKPAPLPMTVHTADPAHSGSGPQQPAAVRPALRPKKVPSPSEVPLM